MEAPQRRKEFHDIFRGRHVGPWRRWRRRLKRLKDDIFRILERAALETLIDQVFDFGSGDLDGHGRSFQTIPTVPRRTPARQAGGYKPTVRAVLTLLFSPA